MAAMYDENYNYIGDDGMGDATPMPKPTVDPEVAKLLARYPAPPSSPTFVDRVKQTIVQAPFALRDVGKMATMFHPMTMAAPIVAGEVEAAGNAISQYGKEGLYRLIGDKENADRVAAEKQPTIPELWQKYYGRLQPQTEAGKAVMEPIGKVLQNLPMVPSGPRGSGFAVPQPSRPLLTPNDAIALRGEANRVASQVRDIPTDFANAQSGFTRIDPITNKPTYGTKLQTAADSFAQTMERRKAQGLNPVPGVPDVFQPETQLYAVRPDKSVTVVPKVPPTVSADARVGPFDEQRRAAVQMLDALDLGDKQQTTRQYINRYLQMAPNEVKKALRDFNQADLRQMFPNIPDIEDAKAAAETLYSDPDAKEQRERDLLNRFAEAHPQFKLPTFDEHQQRVNAVQTMIQDEYVPWVAKHAGTPSDPQLLLAQEGKTVMEPEKLLERASDYKPSSVTTRNRVAAGFPAQGTVYQKRLELQAQLDQAKEAAAASQSIYAAQASAAGPGQSAHRMFADFNANRAQAKKDAAVVKDLEKKVENTTLGMAYEDLVDQLVEPHIASAAQAQVMPRMQQFYPKLMKQDADQTVYSVAGGTYDTMALGTKIAEDIMAGKIPLKVVPKLQDFTPLARKYGEAQAQAYAARKEADKNFVVNANTRLKGIVDQVPQERRFDKLGAIFFDSSMPIEQVNKLASDDTALLDHCIGEAGQTRHKSKLTDKSHGWVPMYNVATGALEPNATRSNTRYADRIANGNYVVASLRDTETGYPITTIGWQALGNGQWATEYLSGVKNKEAIKPEYHKSIKDFLNNVAAGNAPSGVSNFKIPNVGDLQNYYSLFDKTNSSSMGFARATLGTAEKQALKDNPDILQQLPRFFDKNDFKQAIAAPVPSADTPDNVRALTQAKNVLMEELEDLRYAAASSASPETLQVAIDDVNHEIADIDARLARATPDAVAGYVAAQQRQEPAQQPDTGLLQQARDAYFPLIGNAHPLATRTYISDIYRALADITEQHAGNEPFGDTTARLIQVLANARQNINDNTQARLNVGTNNADYIDNTLGTVQRGLERMLPTEQPAPVASRGASVADLFVEFEQATTPAQLRDLAFMLSDRGSNRDAAESIASIGDTLGDFRLRRSDFTRDSLANVGRILSERADLLEQQQFIQQQQRQVPVANTGLTQQTINDIQADIVNAFEVDDYPAWRREVMPILNEHWDPTAPMTSINNMRTDLEMLMRDVDQTARTYHYISLEDLHEGLGNILTGVREIVAQGNLQNALATPQARMAQITREQADVMPYAELSAAVGDPTQYDPIVARAVREIRMNESPASTVVDNIIGGGHIGNHDLSMMSAVERELIARDVTDAVSALEVARAAPRNTPRQQMVSAYVNALQHPDPAVNSALQSIRNVMDDITIDGQGNGLSYNEIGGELLADISTRITSIDNRRRQGELLQGLSREQTASVTRALEEAREQVAQTMIRNAEQQVAQQQQPPQELQPQPRTPLPDIGDFIQTVRRDVGMQVAERVETVAFRVAENITPAANPLGYAQALRAAAHNEDSMQVEVSLNELANAFEESHIGAIVDTMLPDDQHGANRPAPLTDRDTQEIAFELFNDTRRGDNPNAPRNLEDLRTTLQALETAVFDDARFRRYPPAEQEAIQRQVAQHIRSIMNDVGVQLPDAVPTEQQADLFRDTYSNANVDVMPVIPDELAGHIIDDEMSNIFRTYGEYIGEHVSSVVEDILEHMSFEDDPHGVINRLQRHTAQGPLQTRANVEQGLLDIAQRLEESFTAAFEEREQQRMAPNPVAHLFRDMPDAELARQLSPADLGEIDASFEAMMADNNGFAADGVPTLPAAAMLTRRFNVYDLDEPAREALARRFEAEHRDRQQLAVQPAPEVAEPQQGRSVRQLYEEFNDAIANAVEEGDFDPMEYSNADLAQFVLDDAIGGALTEITDAERQALADIVRRHGYDGDLGEDIDAPPPRRGPFQPGGSSAVRGRPLGNLNMQPAITAAALRGPDSQPVRNFLQQVRGLPGVTQEGLATGLMAFENMDPNRRMTKAEFVRELLPSSYDIVDLHGAGDTDIHYRQLAEAHVAEDPETVLNQMGIPDQYHGEILDVVVHNDMLFEDLSSGAKKALRKKNITDYDSLYAAHAEAFRIAVEVGMEYLADMDGGEFNGRDYSGVQRLTLTSMGDEYSEFGVTHPDQQGEYAHYPNAPEGMIGHVRGTYNHADPLELRTSDADIFTTKPGSYVIEEIQSDTQKAKGVQQKAHLHQVHGTLFKAAIQKALESGADTVYLPTSAIIAAERSRPAKEFAPIYDQAIVKEGLKPLLKIPGVKSTLVSNGDYHEITFTPKAIEYILNGPGQTVPGYAKGGLVMPVSKYMGNPTLAGLTYKYGGYVH